MMRNVSFGAVALFHWHRLKIHWKIDVRDSAPAQGAAAGQVCDVADMFGSHHARVVKRYIHEQAVEINILLGVGIDQIVEVMPGDRQHRLAIEFGIIESVQQMNAARS